MKLPERGEYWTHTGFGAMYWPDRKGPVFEIEEIILKEPIDESWVIYCNPDDYSNYFVKLMHEFIQGEWEISYGASKLDQG